MTEWIISSAVLIVVVALVRQLLKGKISLRLQYALWAIVLVRLLVPITFGESKISVLNVLEQTASVVERQEPEVPTQNAPENPMSTTPIVGEPGTPGKEETPGITIDIPPQKWGNDDWKPQTAPALTQAPDGTLSEDWDSWEEEQDAAWEEYKEEYTRHVTVTVPQVLTLLWLCGIAVVALWFLISNLRFWLRLRRSRRVLELDCPIRVYVTGAAETPCLFGLIRPAIYLTPEVAEDEVALRHVLAHELTHYHHWDHIWSVLRCVCLAVHWYNPLVWLAASLSRRDAELACDESTIRRIGEEERTAYGRTLIGLTCVHRSNLLHTATTMTGSKKSLKERIVLIAKKPKMAVYTLVVVILIAAVAVGCTFTGAEKSGEDVEDVESLFTAQTVTKQWKVIESVEVENLTYADAHDFVGAVLYQDLEADTAGIAFVEEDGYYSLGLAAQVYADSALVYEGAGTVLFYLQTESGEPYECRVTLSFSETGVIQLRSESEFEPLPSDTPQAVLDCAEQVLANQLAEYVQENGKGDRTELISLKQRETGTAGLDYAVFVYRLTYNLWWGNGFEYYQRYMVLGYDYFTGEYTLLDDFSADELVALYGTEEMLAKYDGDLFVAAAMETWEEWRAESPRRQIITFEAEILEISARGKLLTVLVNGRECAVEITRNLEIFGLDGAPITSADLAVGQIIEVIADNLVIYEPVETYGSCHVISVIGEAGKTVDPAQIIVQAKTPYQAVERYVSAWSEAHTTQIPYFIQQYTLMDWGADQISADGKAVAGWLECRLIPVGEYSGENSIRLSQRNGSWLYGTLSFVLEQRDGNWCVAGWGNLGDVTLEGCGFTPQSEIEAAATGFLNEYLTELYCYTNSDWLSYTTGGIHFYSVDELSEEEQAIVWAADRNISYLEDKATYWKLSRRGQEISRTDFSISYSDMKIKQSGNRATVKVDAWMSFLYQGETDWSGMQETYEIELAKIGGVWLITDVMQKVFWFDYDYKNDREALDKEIEYWESFSSSKVQQYDLNGDGVIQSVEFPYAEGEAFGLTGEYATLYTAVSEYAGRWLAHEAGGTYLVLPSITKVYGQYEDEQGNMNYVCAMNTLYFDALGSDPGNWKNYGLGAAGDFVLATLDPEGNLVGLKTWPNSPGQELAKQLYREYCGPLEDLAEALINGTGTWSEEILKEYQNADARLAQYLAYYFGA